MNKVEAVIFDLGRVLVNVDIHRGIFGLFGHSSADSMEAAVAQMMREPSYAAFNAGRLSPERFYEAMKEKFSLKIDFIEFAKQWCDVFEPMEGMEELIAELSGRIQLGLLSDTDPLHWEYIVKNFPVVSLIDKPTLSFNTGFRTPAREAYVNAVENVGVAASKCLYVDDLMENVQGALNAGLQATQFKGTQTLRREMNLRNIII